ncbi:MAG TPA: malate:quinone oxidoreductase, partial [Planococcus sp. (in: firmicutes)]|nr:malate:quinone oxidoreductase [Planococcus sp. (in: firmicutes)]
FPQHLQEWEPKIKEMVPSYGISLADNPEMFEEIHASTAKALALNETNITASATSGAEAKLIK